MLAKGPRYSPYFGPNGDRLTTRPEDFDEPETGRAIQLQIQTQEYSRDPKPPIPSAPLEDKICRFKLNDIDDAESKEIMSLLKDILHTDPMKRPSAAELLTRPWFST
jgi:serine/threonine protein kinase